MVNLDSNNHVAIENLNTWELHFRSADNTRDIVIPSNVKNWKILTIGEVDAQVKLNNGFFCGKNGMGKNASIKILDDEVRKYVFGIEEEKAPKQEILDLDAIKELFATTPQSAFEKKLKTMVVTDAEKRRIVMLAQTAGIDNVEVYKKKAIEKLAQTKIE